LCVECLKENRLTPAEVVDHIKPHRGDPQLFWDVSNWQSLCVAHHNIKTAKEKI
jgi:5-methylcytosine-specific restriction protein A